MRIQYTPFMVLLVSAACLIAPLRPVYGQERAQSLDDWWKNPSGVDEWAKQSQKRQAQWQNESVNGADSRVKAYVSAEPISTTSPPWYDGPSDNTITTTSPPWYYGPSDIDTVTTSPPWYDGPSDNGWYPPDKYLERSAPLSLTPETIKRYYLLQRIEQAIYKLQAFYDETWQSLS